MFGSGPSGVLILCPEGRTAAIITPSGQQPPLTGADRARAFQELIAYSGRYRLDPPDRFVTTVEVAWFQPWLGTEQARSFNLDAETLNIVSDPSTRR